MQISEKHKSILTLLSDGEFHSGNAIAKTLNISRASVWKHLLGLPQLGVHYSAVNGKGYRLNKPLELLDKKTILSFIEDANKPLMTAMEIFDIIDSTNRYLCQATANSIPSGSVCMAEQQTAGKGRRGRQWVSPFGYNIYMSILWRFQTGPHSLSGLSLAVGVAVIRALNQLYPKVFALKWPNDIYYQNKKLGGILVEVFGESEGPCTAIIGFGLNGYLPVEEASAIAQAWIDLSSIVPPNSTIQRNRLAGTLLNQLLPLIADFQDKGIAGYLDEWRQYDCLKNKSATLFIGQQHIEGVVNGIDDHGLLILTLPDGTQQTFASGEISFSGAP